MENYPILVAARRIGVSKSTLQYWFRQGMVEDVGRDARGWRVFSAADIRRLRAFRNRPRVRVPVLGAERRKTVRVAVHLPLKYALRGPQGVGAPVEGDVVTENVSRGGLMFRIPTPPPIRAAGRFRMGLAPGRTVLTLDGAIRWVQGQDGGQQVAVGVAFAPLTVATRRALTTALYRPRAERL